MAGLCDAALRSPVRFPMEGFETYCGRTLAVDGCMGEIRPEDEDEDEKVRIGGLPLFEVATGVRPSSDEDKTSIDGKRLSKD